MQIIIRNNAIPYNKYVKLNYFKLIKYIKMFLFVIFI